MNFPPITSGFIGQAGLLLDIIGAFFLSQGFVLKQPEDVVREASSFWNGNPFFLKSAISQRIEARVGFIFLLLGFVGQFLSYTGLFVTGSDSVSGELIVLGVVIWAITFVIVGRISGVQASKAVRAEFGRDAVENIKEALEKNDKEKIESRTRFYGDPLNMPRRKHENASDHAKRILDSFQGKEP